MAKFILVADCEIVFEGNKSSCLKHFKALKKPVNMRLLWIKQEGVLVKNEKGKIKAISGSY